MKGCTKNTCKYKNKGYDLTKEKKSKTFMALDELACLA
jgi:hypothetical protein